MDRARWHLRVLGGASLAEEGGKRPSRASRRHPLALLALLALAPAQTRSREKLIGLLWPELPEDRGRARLRTTLHVVRKGLDPESILSVGGDLRLNLDLVRVDAIDFLRALEEGRLEDAVGLYTGSFLDGFYLDGAGDFERWSDGERRRFRRLYEDALEALAQESAERGESGQAASWWKRLAETAPESGRRVLRAMEALDLAGERGRALEWAERHRRTMQEEYGADSAAEIVALERRLRVQDLRGKEQDAVPVRPAIPTDRGRSPTDPGDPARGGRTRSGRRWSLAAGLTALLATAAFGGATLLWQGEEDDGPDRILVLEFENRTADPTLDGVGRMAGDWIAAGATESGLARAVPAPGLLMPARNRGELEFDAGASPESVTAMARDFSADLVIAGYFHRRRDSLVFRARIVDGASGELVRIVPEVAVPADDPAQGVEELRRRTLGTLATAVDKRLAGWMQAASQPPSLEAYRLFTRGLERFNEGGIAERLAAAELFEQAVRIDAGFTAPLVWAVRARRWAVDHAGADSLLRAHEGLREKMPPWDRAMFDFERASILGDLPGAYRAVRRIIGLAPTPEWRRQLASVALYLDRPTETIELISDLGPAPTRMNGFGPLHFTVLADALHRLGEYEAELERAREWGDLFPDLPTFQELRPLAALGEVELLAQRLADGAEEPRPGRTGPLLRRVARELEVHGHQAAADAFYARSIEAFKTLPPDQMESRRMRNEYGRALMALGRWDDAQSLFEVLAAENPDVWAFHFRLGIIAARQGDVEKARGIDQRLAGMEGPYSYGEAMVLRAGILGALGDHAAAMDRFRWALDEGLAIHDGFHTLEGFEELDVYGPYPEEVDLTRLP